jgi:protein TonB
MAAYAQSSGYRPRRGLSPVALGGVVAIHVGLAAGLLTLSHIDAAREEIIDLVTRNIPEDKPPEPVTQPPVKPEVTTPPQHRITRVDPKIDVASKTDDGGIITPPLPPLGGNGDGGIVEPQIQPPAPILIEAKIDGRYRPDFQPAYPASMVRLQKEGDVTVRVFIDPDGRVRDVQLVSAPDPAFFDATRTQALKRWRFVPATRDGVPMASEKVMTIQFKLTD